jgi:Uma2 family endonuclease
MSEPLIEINVDDLITEDDAGVDNFPSEKQQRLLTEPLYSSWAGPGAGRNFLAAANVGIFSGIHEPPIVPDVFLSLDVEIAEDWWQKSHRSYFIWEFGKAPEVAIEIVSNKEGKEDREKMNRYARMGLTYYVIFDPLQQLSSEILTVYGIHLGKYTKHAQTQLPGIGLGLQLWQGEFERKQTAWLRWCDEQGNIILTGKERAEQERLRAEQEHKRAEQERLRAEQEHQRAERLAEMLRKLGHNPDQ